MTVFTPVQRFLSLLALICTITTVPSHAQSVDWSQALAGEHRSDANRARDPYRHPAETLDFFGVTPTSTVLEMYPGGGWYTEVLAPVLANSGTLYAAHMGVNESPYARRSLGAFLSKIGANNDVYKSVVVTEFNPPESLAIAPPNSVDVALAFRNLHSWIRLNTIEKAFMAVYDSLKPGGVFGIVQHRGNPGMTVEQMKNSGYVTEAYAIELAELVGFELVAKSEINANPKDTKDYENGVWTLPPSYRLGDQDREKYEAIGESDRMTLKFRKPE